MSAEMQKVWDDWAAEHDHPEVAKLVLDWLAVHDCEELYQAADSIVDLIMLAKQQT